MKYIFAKTKDITNNESPIYEIGIYDCLLKATNKMQKKILKKYDKNMSIKFKEHDEIIYINLGKYDYFIDIVDDNIVLSNDTETV